MRTCSLIVAAGRGSRMGNDIPKQYVQLAGQSVLARSVRTFANVPEITEIRVVIAAGDEDAYAASIASCEGPLGSPVTGGASRQESAWRGLEALAASPPDRVVIHDAARPMIDAGTIRRVLSALERAPAAIAALPVIDTLKQAGPGGIVAATVPRQGLWRAQTPQGFHYAEILDAHRRAREGSVTEFTDDAQVAEWAGMDVAIVEGSEDNIKMTTAADLARVEQAVGPLSDYRTGNGFDVHKFAAGDHVWLCGVKIPHSHTLEGHSDADVGLHALTDAILGALGEGDIGLHFPPSEARWKGADSKIFLAHAAHLARRRGAIITNADITLLCEAPKIGPYREAMRSAIADTLSISLDRVGVKATTTEGLGFTGRREGIAAMATATLRLPAYPHP